MYLSKPTMGDLMMRSLLLKQPISFLFMPDIVDIIKILSRYAVITLYLFKV